MFFITGEEIAKLREYCSDFAKLRDNTVDGNGNNLHDIKNTFDYVIKTIEDNNLSGTNFGSELLTKAENCANVLSQLWLTLQTLEKSINSFCDAQEKNNTQF